MAKPQGYSKAAVEEIAERYQAKAAAMNKGRTATIDKTNVVHRPLPRASANPRGSRQ